jgi:hypothetical protein
VNATRTSIHAQLPAESTAASALSQAEASSLVNRTHRVVRERARLIQVQRRHARSLWIPLTVCASLLVILCSAVWIIFDEYELNPTGMPDASNQIFVLLLWFLPVSLALLAIVWFRQTRVRGERELAQ